MRGVTRVLLLATAVGFCTVGCARTSAPGDGAAHASAPTLASPSGFRPGMAFREVAAAAGLDYRWVVPGGEKRPLNALQTNGNGCAFLDYDGDGSLDVLLVGSPVALYRGDGKGRFTNVSAETGVAALKGYFLGCAVGDYDNDGHPDIYLTAYRGGALLHNEGGKAFRDVGAASGVAPQPWGSSAAFADVDGDGTLDLFVGNYLDFGPDTVPQLCTMEGTPTACGPRYYKPLLGALYKGDGKGSFADVTVATGLQAASGKVLGVAFGDPEGDGRESLALANDEMPGDLFRPEGPVRAGAPPRYKNRGAISGTAYSREGNMHGGMGIDWGDYDNDGRLDLFVGTFQSETKCVYRNDGGGMFTEIGDELGLTPGRPLVTFGAKWLDYDNDGWLDLAFSSGHVQDNIDAIDKNARYRQPTLLFRNEGGKRLADASAALDPAARVPIVGRGLAVGDYDNDGRVDMLVVDSEGAPLLLHNEAPDAGNWLSLKLVGKSGARDAYGAMVTAEAEAGRRLLRRCGTDGSYMSASDPRVHFGLGAAKGPVTVTVRWPGGRKTVYRGLAPNARYALTEGDPAARRVGGEAAP